jgi:hypothetical protein
MANLGALKRYAQMTDLAGLPASVLFSHTASSLTVFDAYPKAKFHFLVMPRILSGTISSGERGDMSSLPEPLNAPQLHNLRTLLKIDKSRSKELLVALREDAMKVGEVMSGQTFLVYKVLRLKNPSKRKWPHTTGSSGLSGWVRVGSECLQSSLTFCLMGCIGFHAVPSME